MNRRGRVLILALSVLPGVFLFACSGGGSSSGVSVQGKTVYWEAPQYFTDNTPLVPSGDLQGYEIYIRQDSTFGPADDPVATASALATTYNLSNLDPPLSKGVTYYVSLRTVTMWRTKSDFSPAVEFIF